MNGLSVRDRSVRSGCGRGFLAIASGWPRDIVSRADAPSRDGAPCDETAGGACQNTPLRGPPSHSEFSQNTSPDEPVRQIGRKGESQSVINESRSLQSGRTGTAGSARRNAASQNSTRGVGDRPLLKCYGWAAAIWLAGREVGILSPVSRMANWPWRMKSRALLSTRTASWPAWKPEEFSASTKSIRNWLRR